MNELDMIRLENKFREATEMHTEVMHLYKALQISTGRIDAKEEEVLDLIKYFEETDQFEICEKLKSKLK